jgi:hypothetical protein
MMDDGQLALGIVGWMVAFLFGEHLQVGLAELCNRARLAAHPARRPS